MKNTIIAMLATVTLLQTSAAWAFGHENEGTTLCSGSEYTCQNSDNSIVTCVFTNQVYVVVNGLTHVFSAQLAPVPKGIMGAGQTFTGNDVNLKIQTDAAELPAGWPGYLTVPSLELNSTNLRCLTTPK